MPSIKKLQTKKYFLPSFDELPEKEQGHILLETPLRMSNFEGVPAGSEMKQQAFIISRKIKSWNMCDEKGKKLSITSESIMMLDPSDFGKICLILELDKMMRRLSKGKKKISTSTS